MELGSLSISQGRVDTLRYLAVSIPKQCSMGPIWTAWVALGHFIRAGEPNQCYVEILEKAAYRLGQLTGFLAESNSEHGPSPVNQHVVPIRPSGLVSEQASLQKLLKRT